MHRFPTRRAVAVSEAEDWTVELAVLRNALSSVDLHDTLDAVDSLIGLALRAVQSDLHRWHHHTAPAHGATATNPLDFASHWNASDVDALNDSDRLAWLAAALDELADLYWGIHHDSNEVAGHRINCPDGLIRALVHLREPQEFGPGRPGGT